MLRQIVGPFCMDIRFDRFEKFYRCVFVENTDEVDARQRCKHFCAIVLLIDRTLLAFQSAHRCIGIKSHSQNIAQLSGGLKKSHMPDMQ